MNGYWPAISVAGHDERRTASAGHHWPRRTGTLWTMPREQRRAGREARQHDRPDPADGGDRVEQQPSS